MDDLDGLWREYEKFENDWSTTTAETVTAKPRENYAAAKKAYRERKQLWNTLKLTLPARPPTYDEATGKLVDKTAESQLEAWRALLDWEATNPQSLEPDVQLNRMRFTYRCALVCFRHFPEVWYGLTAACREANDVEAEREAFQTGIEALPDSLLLTFAYADFEEGQEKASVATDAYDKLLARSPSPLAYIQYMRFCRRVLGVDRSRKVFSLARKAGADTHQVPTSFVCTQHMPSPGSCFSAHSVLSGRNGCCGGWLWQVYTAMARIELFLNKEVKIAGKVYEAGMKKHANEPQ